MRKLFVSFAIASVLIVASMFPVWASDIRVAVNGAIQPELPTVAVDGHLLVNIHSLAEMIGAEFIWTPERVTLIRDHMHISIYIGADTMRIGNAITLQMKTTAFQVPPMLVDGAWFYPLEAIIQAFGISMGWNGEVRVLFIGPEPDWAALGLAPAGIEQTFQVENVSIPSQYGQAALYAAIDALRNELDAVRSELEELRRATEPGAAPREFEYWIYRERGGVIITRYIGASQNVQIPAYIEGFPVMELGDGAFRDSAVMSVHIPSTVTTIGHNVFSGATELSNITTEGGKRPGSLVLFGGMLWRVLDVQYDMVLIVSENVLFTQAYHLNRETITWEHSTLRRYLNSVFYSRVFSDEERERIVETTIRNNPNTQFNTPGGSDTADRIFIPSIEEVILFFNNNSARTAYNRNGAASWWWMRSPGLTSYTAARVGIDGNIYVIGDFVNNEDGGVRPALWLRTSGE